MKLRRTQQAFTLIELLVVLAIMASVGAFVAPNMWQSLQRSNERALVMAYAHDILGVRRDRYREGRSLVLAENQLVNLPDTPGLPPPPSGWSIRRHTAMGFFPSGATSGGSLFMDAPSGRLWQLQFAVLDGQITVGSL